MTNAPPRRFVLVAPPTVQAAIGEVLRKVFNRPELRSMKLFERLIEKLDRY